MTASLDQPGSRDADFAGEGAGRLRVVVGVDDSAGSRGALAHAFVAAARRGADVEVVCSYGVELGFLGGAPVDVPNAGIRDDQEMRARALVAQVRGELAVSHAPGIGDIGVTVFVSADPAARALLDRSEGAALLVVGSRGRGAVRSALLGSVALHCVTHATCPVVVVHHAAAVDVAHPGRVVVGVDGSERSRAALAVAVDEAFRMGADVEVVATYAPTDYWTDQATAVSPTVEDIRSDLDQRTHRLVDDVLADRPDRAGAPPAVRTEVHEGSAGDVLMDRARGADLLVVGSRGRGALRGLLLGSVALHCAMHAACAVMVVHPQRDRTPGGMRPEPALATP